ncbi:hypothetical protein EDEG_02047 [Edhazardia aedis USNM 41457]|uniref:Uncharacterized protein n=1 Tax=Edhazardia aedis (strain USNM 41457) TaxID=1003232 RepID=J9D766_EDHAE|nr:hypothetical protein EDEG_02047 [Edhazardia aedis USNM 41457]|eukprot:EJW03616.1 hypothetical protein EDEG_02047 [Edhazardia aedis USNM 41457]
MKHKKLSEEDDPRLGHIEHKDRKRFRWSVGKVFFVGSLYAISFVLIILALYPVLQGDLDTKIVANQLFTLLHVYYMISFRAVKRDSQYYFWSGSYLVLDASTFLFFFHDDIFL